MEPNQPPDAPPPLRAPPAPSSSFTGEPEPTFFEKLKKMLGPVGVVLVLIFKFFAKLKFVLLPVLKFLPLILKTGGSMIVTIWVYALFFGAWFAVGFVVLIFIHECGHLVAAKRLGLKVGAPVFIPFMGAFIALKEAPRNAWIEAQVGIGGPILGGVGAGICELIYFATGNLFFRALAHVGFWLNLFNLIPIGYLDGGRVATALSPWLWAIGFVIMTTLLFTRAHFNILLVIILIASLPRLFFLFRKKSDEERRYFEVTPAQRWTMTILYFGLMALLVIGMETTKLNREHLPERTPPPEQIAK